MVIKALTLLLSFSLTLGVDNKSIECELINKVPEYRNINEKRRKPFILTVMNNAKSFLEENINETNLKAGLILYGAYNMPYINNVAPLALQARFIREFFLPPQVTRTINPYDIPLAERVFNTTITRLQQDITFECGANLLFSLELMIGASCVFNLLTINIAPYLVALWGAHITVKDCNELDVQYLFNRLYYGKHVHSAYIYTTNLLLVLSGIVLCCKIIEVMDVVKN